VDRFRARGACWTEAWEGRAVLRTRRHEVHRQLGHMRCWRTSQEELPRWCQSAASLHAWRYSGHRNIKRNSPVPHCKHWTCEASQRAPGNTHPGWCNTARLTASLDLHTLASGSILLQPRSVTPVHHAVTIVLYSDRERWRPRGRFLFRSLPTVSSCDPSGPGIRAAWRRDQVLRTLVTASTNPRQPKPLCSTSRDVFPFELRTSRGREGICPVYELLCM
jgi:hypothetical protein